MTQSLTPPGNARNAAQRQADRRRRLQQKGDYQRIKLWIDVSAYFALRRLARRDAVTQTEVIASLIKQADQKIIDQLDETTPEWDDYFGHRRSPATPSNKEPETVENSTQLD